MHTYTSDQLRLFVAESNLIEGITRDPLLVEIEASERLLSLDRMTTSELCRYQWAIAPEHPLRVAPGMDIEVGRPERAVRGGLHRQGGGYAPAGGPNIRARLNILINRANSWCAQRARRPEIVSAIEDRAGDRVRSEQHLGGGPWEVHLRFRALHPFMDSNGRTSRILWLWQMRDQGLERSFLHQFYYQTLESLENS